MKKLVYICTDSKLVRDKLIIFRRLEVKVDGDKILIREEWPLVKVVGEIFVPLQDLKDIKNKLVKTTESHRYNYADLSVEQSRDLLTIQVYPVDDKIVPELTVHLTTNDLREIIIRAEKVLTL
jgi:hypothetical protein